MTDPEDDERGQRHDGDGLKEDGIRVEAAFDESGLREQEGDEKADNQTEGESSQGAGRGQAGGVQEGGKMCDHRLGHGGRTGKEKGLDAEEGDSQMPHEEEDPEGAQGWQDRLQQFQQTVFRHRVPRFSGG